MKNRSLLGVVLLGGLLCLHTVAAAQPSTVIPVPSKLKKFMPRLHLEKLEEAKSGDIDFVMIGDSITHAWSRHPEALNGIKLLNLGFPGDRTQNVLWRLQHGAIDGLSPKLVTLMIGTNHMHEGKKGYAPDDPADIFTGIEAVVAELRTRLPEAKLLVFSLFPRKPGPENDRVNAVNALLPRLADGRQVFHVDINQAFVDTTGRQNTSLFSRDRLHLNPDGYAAWAKALLPLLQREGITAASNAQAASVKRGKSADGATKKEYLANKKKNIEARGKHYDPTQWSEHFDRMDLDKDGVLRPQEQAAYEATKKAGKTATEAASKAQQAPAKSTGQSPVATVPASAISSSDAPFTGSPATTVWFKQPGKGFDQSLVIGNGRVGAMVYGSPDEERIILNEESVWSGSRGENNVPGGYQYLPEMRRLLAEEKFAEANALKRKAFPTKGAPKYANKISPFGRYQTLGTLRLTFSGTTEPVTDYRRELDLSTGLGTVTYKRGETSFSREHFVSAPDEVFVSRLTGPIAFSVALDRPERFETTAVNDRELLISGHLNDGYDQDGMLYVGRLRVVGGTAKADGNRLVVSSEDEVLLLFAAATDYRGIAGRQLTDPLGATTSDLDKAETKSYAQLRTAQKRDHAQFFNRVTLQLPETDNSRLPTDQRLAAYREGAADPSLTALFANMGRYLLISSSRPGGLVANLQGIWAEEVHTMWNGDYHFNINTQMNYWPALTCNLVEMQEPLNTFIASLVEPGSKTAKAYYDSPGWIAHRMTNVWGYTAPAGLDIGGPAWLCEHLWEQYAFTLDKTFLADVYPVMKGSVEFYLYNLYEEPENKWLVTGPSASPENGFHLPNGGTGSGICVGPTIDMQQLRELFGNTIQAARILGVDEDLQRELLEKRPRLAPNQIAPDGVLQEWLKPYEEREPTHRHCSPLYGLYPYYEITPDGTPEIAEAARKLLERRGVGQSTGWSNAWRVNLWARMADAEKSWDFAHRMLTDNCFDNMLSQFRPGKRKLFQIEANFGLTSGVIEMLLQSQPESGAIGAPPVIRLLPALPKQWPAGKVTGLRARGGFEVNIEWKDGALVSCSLLSLGHHTCKVRYGDWTETLTMEPAESRTIFATGMEQ